MYKRQYKVREESGRVAVRNGKILKPVHTDKNAKKGREAGQKEGENGEEAGNSKTRSWADVVRGPEIEKRTPSVTERPARSGDKSVTFSETCKTKDGGNPVRRRSSRLQKKKLRSAGERFIRKITPRGITAWGPFVYKIDKSGLGSWYEEI